MNLVADPKVMQSIKRYSESGFRWFGERTDSEGYIRQGGSNRTAAYKAAATLIDAAFELKTPAATSAKAGSRTFAKREVIGVKQKSGSPIATIAIIVIAVFIILWAIL